jgi:hypothetical protein
MPARLTVGVTLGDLDILTRAPLRGGRRHIFLRAANLIKTHNPFVRLDHHRVATITDP